MVSDFERFTRAVDQGSSARKPTPQGATVTAVTVLGGGADGKLLAALLLAEGLSVTLFSAYGADMDAIRSTGGITLRGDGPTGTYQIDRDQSPSIQTTAQLDTAVASADMIFLTGPVHKQRTYAMVLADHLRDGQILVVAPARTFAALETDWLLHVGGCQADYTIVELQHLPFWTVINASTLHLSSCNSTTAAVLPSGRTDCIQTLSFIYDEITVAPSVIHSGFSDAGGAVESVSLLLGGSLIHQSGESLPEGAVALEERRTLRSLIETERCLALLETLLQERRDSARPYGVRDFPDNNQWMKQHSGTISGSGSRKIPSQGQAVDLLHCAVVGSLVPLQSAAKLAGVTTPATDSIITLASASLKRKLETAGRKLENMGIDVGSTDITRRHLESVARGER